MVLGNMKNSIQQTCAEHLVCASHCVKRLLGTGDGKTEALLSGASQYCGKHRHPTIAKLNVGT